MTVRFFLFTLAAVLLFPQSAIARIPNDPQGTQWGYTTTHVYDAWEQAVGSHDVVVAVIDNGFDDEHPDLKANVWKNVDEIPNNNKDDDANGYIDDVWGWSFVPRDGNGNGMIDQDERRGHNAPRPNRDAISQRATDRGVVHHGTLVAGIIGAVGDNDRDGAGINWNVQLMNIQLLGSNGSGGLAPLPEAIRYAVDNGAHVINLSVVGRTDAEELSEAIEYAYQNGVVVVAAAGNNAESLNLAPQYPICSDQHAPKQKVLGVSAISQQRSLAVFSNHGSSCVDITAPGVNVASTLYVDRFLGLSSTYRDGWNGTSFATPFVAGAAALVKSIQPTWGPDEIYTALLSTVHRTEPNDEELYAELFGNGLLRVDRAVQYALDRLSHVDLLERIAFIDGATGQGRVVTLESAGSKKSVFRQVNGADQIRAVRLDDGYRYAALRFVDGISTVRVYAENWELLSSVKLNGNTLPQVQLADMHEHPGVELIVDTNDPQQAFFIYSQDGNLLASAPRAEQETGKRLYAVTSGSTVGHHLLLSSMVDAEFGPVLERFDGSGARLGSIRLNIVEDVHAIAAADYDGDHADEYIVVSSAGGQTMFRIYEWDGVLKRQSIIDTTVPGPDLQLLTGDLDVDGKEDILVYRGPRQTMSIYLDQAKRTRSLDPSVYAIAPGSTMVGYPSL